MTRATPRRALLAALALGASALLGSCAYLPEAPQGLERGPADDFIALPVRAWLLREDVRPVTVAGCLVEPCTARVGVAVLDMTGAAARDIQRVIGEPDRLRADLQRRDREDRDQRRRGIETAVAVAQLTLEGARGFTIRMARADGTRAAYGVAVARPVGERTRVVIAVADEAPLALSSARQVAGAYLR